MVVRVNYSLPAVGNQGHIQPMENPEKLPHEGLNEDILRHIFLILKDPHQFLVCQFWHTVNSGWKTYRLILEIYNQQEFMTRFTTQLPLQSGEEYVERVKQIFVCVHELVKTAGIKCEVKQARVKEYLGLLELNPIVKQLEAKALSVFFNKLCYISPEAKNYSSETQTIRNWM